jgi:hypothetical protein
VNRFNSSSLVLTVHTYRYHGEGDPNHPVVRIEMEEMELAIETTGSDKVFLNFKTTFQRLIGVAVV